MILLVDNYDSFSYNLYQLIGGIRQDLMVVRNDKITVEEIKAQNFDAIFLSPGPGRPENAGICPKIIEKLGKKTPIFGVCLGHQAICQVYGGTVGYASRLMHGKTSQAKLDTTSKIFKGMEPEIQVARYHSLSAKSEDLPACLQVIAQTVDGEIMAVQHRDYLVYGVQFHPESVLTPDGKAIIQNFLEGLNHD